MLEASLSLGVGTVLRLYITNGKKTHERPNAGGVSRIRSRNGAPSRKGCVVNVRMTKASNK